MSVFETEGFDAFVAALPGTSLADQWDSHVAKVGGKVFTLLSADGGVPNITLKCLEESFEVLTGIEGIRQAPYFAKRKWVTVSRSAELPEEDLEAYLTRSYHLVAEGLTRKVRAELGIG